LHRSSGLPVLRVPRVPHWSPRFEMDRPCGKSQVESDGGRLLFSVTRTNDAATPQTHESKRVANTTERRKPCQEKSPVFMKLENSAAGRRPYLVKGPHQACILCVSPYGNTQRLGEAVGGHGARDDPQLQQTLVDLLSGAVKVHQDEIR